MQTENEYGPHIGEVGKAPVPEHSVFNDGKLPDMKPGKCENDCGNGHWSGH